MARAGARDTPILSILSEFGIQDEDGWPAKYCVDGHPDPAVVQQQERERLRTQVGVRSL